MKKRYRTISLLLSFTLLFLGCLTGYARGSSAVAVKEINGVPYFCVRDLETCSDISVERTEKGLDLEENGLRVHLHADSAFLYRDSRIAASMPAKPILADGQWYAPKEFYDGFLCGGENATPSLFHGIQFEAQEILAALDGSGDPLFHQKLLHAVLLPTSMQINAPHVDMSRVFIETPLDAFSPVFCEEMADLGFQNSGRMAYGEYLVVHGAQTMADAGMASVMEREPELKHKDPNTMTVAQYTTWQQDHARQQFERGLSAEAKSFAEENGIQISDLAHLNRYFNGGYMEKSREELVQVLTEYYAADLAYIQSMCQAFRDVARDDWFLEDVTFVCSEGLMNGTSETSFSPEQVVSRAQIVTILWRMAGEPAAKEERPFQDVPEGKWYSAAIGWAAGEKIADGYGDTFGTDDPMTREQFAAILWRYSKHKGMDVGADKNANLLEFEDAQSVSDYAVEAMRWACGAGIMQGNDGRLLPGHTATRAEAAAMIRRFCKIR